VPPSQQPLDRRLQQVLAGLRAAGEQHGRAQQVIGALGKEALKLSCAPVSRHPGISSSFASQARRSGREGSRQKATTTR
jgi:hypothetical protein